MTVTSVFPILLTRDLPALVAFYERAFDAVVEYRFPGSDGDVYVSMDVGEAKIAVAVDDAVPSDGDRVAIWCYVTDVDDAFRRAVAAGAIAVDEPNDMPWGERVARIRDTDGNLVNLGEPVVA